jgi:DNA repair exonuclease SbcCD ATPase subunit
MEFNDSEAMCPYCHQYLPDEMLAEAKEKFNQHKAELKKSLTERAAKAKQLLADAEVQAKEYEEKKADAETNLTSIKEDINNTFAEKAKLEKEKAALPTYEQLLADSDEYQIAIETIKSKEQEIESVSVTSEDDEKTLGSLMMGKALTVETIKNLSAQFATKDQYDRIQSLIDGIKEEQKDLVKQQSELERKEDVARRYQERQNQVLEERINEHFSLVKWKMFRTVNNGGDPFDEPYCECYVDGVAYHDGLNQAARLNAGLDICNALCKHYNIAAPIIIDQSESTLNILQTAGQQIRLCVADTDLQIL